MYTDKLIESAGFLKLVNDNDEKVMAFLIEKKILQSDQEIIQFLKEHQLPLDNFNYLTFRKLCQLTDTACGWEENLSKEEQDKKAKLNAAKLTILFNDFDKALAYLNRVEGAMPEGKQIIHDACLFNLPNSNQWTPKIWQDLIAANPPSTAQALIMRILPHAAFIEKYVQENKETLIKRIREKVLHQFIEKYSEEFETKKMLSKEKRVEQQLAFKRKKIEKEIQYYADEYIKGALGILKNTKLDPQSLAQFNKRKNNLTPVDINELNAIKKRLYHSYTIKFENEMMTDTKLDKKNYIDAALKHNAKMIDTIIHEKSSHLLSSKTSLNELQSYMQNVTYKNAYQNPKASQLFFREQMLEEAFDLYLTLTPQNDDAAIPNVMLDGATLAKEYEGYYLKKISPDDPRAAVLGKLTSCCQSLTDYGQEPTIFGITDKNAGFYGLYKKKKGGDEEDQIVAQCLAWRGVDDSIVFDSIESQLNFRKKHLAIIKDFYQVLAHDLVHERGVPRVLVGKGNTPKDMGIAIYQTVQPIHYQGYSDATSFQSLLADKNYPFLLTIYKDRYQSVIAHPQEQVLKISKEVAKRWLEYCAFNKSLDWSHYISGCFAEKTQQELESYLKLVNEWITYISDVINIDLEKITSFVERGIDINIPNFHYFSCIELFAKLDKWEVVRFLLENTNVMVPKSTPKHDEVLVYLAARTGQKDIIDLLLKKGANIDDVDGMTSFTALLNAIYWNQEDMIHFLIEHGANIHASDRYKNSALHLACFRNYHHCWEIVDYLLKQGCDVNSKNKKGANILNCFISIMPLNIVKQLINYGIDVNCQDKHGRSALHQLVKRSDGRDILEHLDYLLDHGADINALDDKKNSALHYAANQYNWKVVERLIERGTKINELNEAGENVLTAVLRYQDNKSLSTIKMLVEHGAHLVVYEYNECIPAHLAAIRGNKWQAARFFLEQGADINAQGWKGFTALHFAAQANNREEIEWLLAHGADVNIKDTQGKFFWEYGEINAAMETIKWLYKNNIPQHVLIQALLPAPLSNTSLANQKSIFFQPSTVTSDLSANQFGVRLA